MSTSEDEDEDELLLALLEVQEAGSGDEGGAGGDTNAGSRGRADRSRRRTPDRKSAQNRPRKRRREGERQPARVEVDVPPLLYPLWSSTVGVTQEGAIPEAVGGIFRSAAALCTSVAEYVEQLAGNAGPASAPAEQPVLPGWRPLLRHTVRYQTALTKHMEIAAKARASGWVPPPAAAASVGAAAGRPEEAGTGVAAAAGEEPEEPEEPGRSAWTAAESARMLRLLTFPYGESEWPTGGTGRGLVGKPDFERVGAALGRSAEQCERRFAVLLGWGWTRGAEVPTAGRKHGKGVPVRCLLAALALFPHRTASHTELCRAVAVQPHATDGVDLAASDNGVSGGLRWCRLAREALARHRECAVLKGVRHRRSVVWTLLPTYRPHPVAQLPPESRELALGEIEAMRREKGLAAEVRAVRDAAASHQGEADQLEQLLDESDGQGGGAK